MLWFAHDGSLNADWLSHYAIRFAQHLPTHEVRAVFVEDGSVAQHELVQRLEFLRQECEHAQVKLVVERLGLRGRVAQTLIDRIPAGADSYLLCGTRVRARNLSFLAGTVSERLLAARHCNVLAVRIVQPGTLGMNQDVLVPVMGHPRGFSSGIPFLKLLDTELQRIHVLMVRVPARLWLSGRTSGSRQRLHALGEAYVARVKRELASALPQHCRLDSTVLIASDPANEIVLAAKQHKSDLIYLGTSERSIAERILAGAPHETILRNAPCDVAIYASVP